MADDHKAQGNSTDWEIRKHTTSAPNFIGDFATVIGASGEVYREGTNGWTCLPFIAMPKMGFKSENEATPACADQNAMAWASAYLSQTEPKLENSGWIWMLHGDTGVDNFRTYSEGDKIPSKRLDLPTVHILCYCRKIQPRLAQTADFTTGAPYVIVKDTPYVHLMIPLEGYYDYQPENLPLK